MNEEIQVEPDEADVTRLAIAQRDEARAALARVLSWFDGQTGTRREATATRAQLARIYRDGGLSVPEELRRFL